MNTSSIAGSAAYRTDLPMQRHVRGSVLRSHLRWVEENRLPTEVALLRSELPPEMAREVSSFVVPSAWYPYSWLLALSRTLEDLFGTDDDLQAELGRYSARLILSPIYRLLNAEGPHQFLRQHALRFSHFYDFVTAVYRASEGKNGVISHRQDGFADEIFCRMMLGFYEQVLWSHGVRRASVAETECQTRGARTCSFRLDW